MAAFGGDGGFCRFARLLGLSVGCLALSHCANGNLTSKVDPKYGVATSARVVAPGEAVPKGGGVYRLGKPYTVAGREYVPQEDVNYSATGLASFYGEDFHGRYTANGEVFDMNSISAAHPTLPLPSYVRVTNLGNHRSLVVRVNDRGPYVGNRVIDLSVKSAQLLGFHGRGLAKVKVEYVGRAPLGGSDDRMLAATLRENVPDQAPSVQLASNKPFAPAFFDARPMTPVPAEAQAAANRAYRLGSGPREMAAAQPALLRQASPTVELAAAARPRPADTVTRGPLPATEPAVSPVSAYAATRYDGQVGFMSGRGLY